MHGPSSAHSERPSIARINCVCLPNVVVRVEPLLHYWAACLLDGWQPTRPPCWPAWWCPPWRCAARPLPFLHEPPNVPLGLPPPGKWCACFADGSGEDTAAPSLWPTPCGGGGGAMRSPPACATATTSSVSVAKMGSRWLDLTLSVGLGGCSPPPGLLLPPSREDWDRGLGESVVLVPTLRGDAGGVLLASSALRGVLGLLGLGGLLPGKRGTVTVIFAPPGATVVAAAAPR